MGEDYGSNKVDTTVTVGGLKANTKYEFAIHPQILLHH